MVIKIINQYKNSRGSFIISSVPNQFICFAGYWIEALNPGTFVSIFYEKSIQRIDKYKDIKKEVNEFIKDIDSEYESIKKEVRDLF